MPALYPYRIFISHAWRYSESYERVCNLLTAAPNFSYYNYSIPVSKAFDTMTDQALKEQLREQIRPVSVAMILGGMYVAHSEWIQFEIDYAKSIAKPILGVIPWGAVRMPQAVQVAANEIVNWSTLSIVEAVRQLSR